MKHPLVSVILPVYNGQMFLKESIQSVLHQKYSKLELIIVDDGSTDNSHEIINYFKNIDSRIFFFQKTNGGVSSARNFAIKKSKGSFIAFIDQDDLWLTDKLEKQIRYFENNPNAVFLHSNIDYIDKNGNTINKEKYPWKTDASGNCFKRLFDWNAIAIQTVFFKRECIDKVGLLREDIPGVDDYEYWLRCSRFFSIDYLDEAVALYRFHDENESHKWHLQDIKRSKALEGILEQFPEIYNEIGRQSINKKMVDLYFEIANEFQRKNDTYNSRIYFLKIINIDHFNVTALLGLLSNVLPLSVRSSIKWYIRKLGDIIK